MPAGKQLYVVGPIYDMNFDRAGNVIHRIGERDSDGNIWWKSIQITPACKFITTWPE